MKKSIHNKLEQDARSGVLKGKADNGDTDAAFDWAWCLEHGIGTEESTQEAIKYYLTAARQGDKHALANAAVLMIDGNEKNEEAIGMLQEAARCGIHHAAYNLFIVLKKTHPRKALYYLKQAAEGKNAQAMYELGIRTIAGCGVKANQQVGLSLIRQAAKKDNADALYYLAEIEYHESPQTAFKRYRKAAQSGHIVAMYELACCYRQGHGTKQNHKQEFKWLKQAAENGHVYAMCDVAAEYNRRASTPENDEQYRYWMHRAAEYGDSLAMQNLGFYYWPYFRNAANTDMTQSIEWFSKAAHEGEAKSWFALGRIYGVGNEIEQDVDKAFHCYKNAADGGCEDAYIYAGMHYLYGIGTEADPRQAIKWMTLAVEAGYPRAAEYLYEYCYKEENPDSSRYRKATIKLLRKTAEKQHPESIFLLSICYDKGLGVKKSPQLYYELSRQAAELGHAVATNNLGVHYQRGLIVEQDYAKAAELYLRAAQAGNITAQFNIACLYENGNGVPKDEQQAFYWFKQAADQGDTEACYETASRYRDGRGTEQNAKQAFLYMQAAADDDFIPAFCNLGGMYRIGFGTRKNYKKALYYLENSHMCEYAKAQLGCMLLQGAGTATDMARAVEYLQQAAKKNEPHALYHLGQCYENGWGVEKNQKKAARLHQKAEKLKPKECTGADLTALCSIP